MCIEFVSIFFSFCCVQLCEMLLFVFFFSLISSHLFLLVSFKVIGEVFKRITNKINVKLAKRGVYHIETDKKNTGKTNTNELHTSLVHTYIFECSLSKPTVFNEAIRRPKLFWPYFVLRMTFYTFASGFIHFFFAFFCIYSRILFL